MPKTRKNKSKDNAFPFNKPKLDKIAEGKLELRQNEQDRLNSIIRDKCNEILEIIDLSQIEKQWGLYALLFHCKQVAAFDLHASEFVRINNGSTAEIVKNQREYLKDNYPQFIEGEENTESPEKVLH